MLKKTQHPPPQKNPDDSGEKLGTTNYYFGTASSLCGDLCLNSVAFITEVADGLFETLPPRRFLFDLTVFWITPNVD